MKRKDTTPIVMRGTIGNKTTYARIPIINVEIGKARAERDKLSHELYVMRQKTEQFENIKKK